MSDWKRRIRVAWQVLCGRKCLLTDASNKVIYVQDSGPEGKFVQLMPWRDQVLALDNNGRIWMLDLSYGVNDFKVQLVMESPRRF